MSVFDKAARLAENGRAFAIADKYPIAPGHTLICSKRETASWFDLTPEEHADILSLAKEMRDKLKDFYITQGFVLMLNDGKAQHVPHVHLHVIPYYREQPGGPLEWR